MPFRRLFGRGDPEPDPRDTPDAEHDTDNGVPDEDPVVPEHDAFLDDVDGAWRGRAGEVIPGASSTGSKRPAAIYGPDNEVGPIHYARAAGCLIVTPSDETIIDCTMALGSVAMGYADDAVSQRVINAIAMGNVSGFSHTSEVELAERLCDVIPCAEQVRFMKTGADAVSAAIRIARTYSGRDRIIASGYFGWHDWSNDVAGVPLHARADVQQVPFDDVAALERACGDAGASLAAIILEPVVERLPSVAWVAAARRLADASGAVLIFDEMKTGFRLKTGGYQELSGVEPDLATFGKAMANGFPLAAVVGRSAVMEATTRTWISSTLAGETVGVAAALAVLDLHEAEDVCMRLAGIGVRMQDLVRGAIEASGISGVSVDGLDPMWSIRFDDADLQTRFIERALRHGVLFKRGAYNFASLAHDDEEILLSIERAASSAFVELIEEDGA